MRTKAKRGGALAAITAAALLVALVPAAQAKPGAGPKTAKCGKLKKKAQKKRCQKQNQANRIAFNQFKNSRFEGFRGDGEELEAVYCANGKFESRLTGSYGTGITAEKRWWVMDAVIRRGGKWIDMLIGAPGGFQVGYQKRGNQWKYGIASFGEITEAGDVEKTNAAGECRTLQV